MKLDHELTGVSSSLEMAEFYKALNLAQRSYKAIKRSGLNKVEGFRYSTFKDICDATLPSLLEQGFTMPTFSMGYDRNLGTWVMVGCLVHASGQWSSSVCPLLMGYTQDDRPGIRVLEANATYAKKILMAGLCGGWSESDEVEAEQEVVEGVVQKTEPVVAEVQQPALPEPVRQQKKRSKPQPPSEEAKAILARADEVMAKKKGDPEGLKKCISHLDSLVATGKIPSSDALVLKAKYLLDGKEAGFKDPFPAPKEVADEPVA
jgi:hypothetical protein